MTTRERQMLHNGMNGSTEVRRHTVQPWLAVLVILLGAIAIGLSWNAVNTGPDAEPPQDGRASLLADALTPTPTAGPTELPPPATATPLTELISSGAEGQAAAAPAQPIASTPTQPEIALPLPTVTPTPEVVDIAPRTAQIGGSTTLRVALSGQEFQSTGQPLRFSIDARTHGLDAGTLAVTDAWCMQLGLANLYFDLGLRLNPATEELVATGQIALHSDFCDNPGPLLDTVDVNVTAPTGATAKIAYNLRGERAFFGDTNLLNTDVGVIVDLEITNSRPR